MEAAARRKKEEMKKIKWEEENALSIALGYGPIEPMKDEGWGEKGPSERGTGDDEMREVKSEKEIEIEKLEAEEKARKKA